MQTITRTAILTPAPAPAGAFEMDPVRSIAEVPTNGNVGWIALDPDSDMCTAFGVRYVTDPRGITPELVEISRDGKGDRLFFDLRAARHRMTGVRIGGVDNHNPDHRCVCFIGFDDRNWVYTVSWGLSWPRGERGPVNYYHSPLTALVEVGIRYIL